MKRDPVRHEVLGDGVAVIELARPEKKNALTAAMRRQFSRALEGLSADENVRCILITAVGDVFCAGFDLAEFDDADLVGELWSSSDEFHHTVLRCPLPTIAVVNGPALAGGFDLATLADVRVGTPTAHFAHPEQRWAPVLYRPLRDRVGGAIARELVLTGRRVDAAEALRIGLLNRVVPADEALAVATDLARSIAHAPRWALERVRRKIVDGVGVDPATPTLDI